MASIPLATDDHKGCLGTPLLFLEDVGVTTQLAQPKATKDTAIVFNLDSCTTAPAVPASCLYFPPRALSFACPADDGSVDPTDGSYDDTVGCHSSRTASSG